MNKMFQTQRLMVQFSEPWNEFDFVSTAWITDERLRQFSLFSIINWFGLGMTSQKRVFNFINGRCCLGSPHLKKSVFFVGNFPKFYYHHHHVFGSSRIFCFGIFEAHCQRQWASLGVKFRGKAETENEKFKVDWGKPPPPKTDEFLEKFRRGGGVISNPKIYIAKFGLLNRAFLA